MINLDMEKRSSKYYGVGYIRPINKFVLYTVVTWITWYNRYYEISEEEYHLFDSGKLDELAEKLYKLENRTERFLFSDKNEENNEKHNEKQLELHKKANLN